jgi:hypothetical protein
MRKRLILIFLVLIVVLGISLFFIFRGNNCEPPVISSTASSTDIGQDVEFKTEVEAESYHWDFGDGNTSSEQNPVHNFATAGDFLVTMYLDDNTECKGQINIKVNESLVLEDTTNKVSLPDIKVPTNIRVAESVQFEDLTIGASKWTWMFGESGDVDSKEKKPNYTFKNAGTYEIEVSNDVAVKPARIKVVVSPMKIIDKKTGAERKAPEMPKSILISKLQTIANGDIKAMSFFKTLLCNEQIPVKINSGKVRPWIDYCQAISIEEDKLILDIILTKNPQTNCISSIDVTQKIK